jgi:hypothetical protein
MAKKTPTPTKPASNDLDAVDKFLASLQHPHKAAIQALRETVRSAHPSIREGIKWNAPSFRTTEYFATTHLHAKSGIALILHLGAKKRAAPSMDIKDPTGLLKWLGKDRAMIAIAKPDEVRAISSALRQIVRQWIKYV